MMFKGINNQTVEFKITNYEFPKNTTCEYDSNWLLICLKVNSTCEKWQTIDPVLLTEEIKEIIEWFENLSINIRPKKDNLNFIEPNIKFELKEFSNDRKTIKMIFDLESRPKNADDDKEYFVELKFNNEELKQVAEDLKNEMYLFPTRGFE